MSRQHAALVTLLVVGMPVLVLAYLTGSIGFGVVLSVGLLAGSLCLMLGVSAVRDSKPLTAP